MEITGQGINLKTENLTAGQTATLDANLPAGKCEVWCLWTRTRIAAWTPASRFSSKSTAATGRMALPVVWENGDE
jgi:hypothetical protein